MMDMFADCGLPREMLAEYRDTARLRPMLEDDLTIVFLSDKHIRQEWGKHFYVEDIIDEGHNYQAVTVLTNPG